MILITGGTGTSGTAIVKAVLDRGRPVRALARDPAKAEGVLPGNVEIARGDYSDGESLIAAMDGIERALLLSPPSTQTVEMEQAFFNAAKQAGVKHVVKFSAMLAAPDAPDGFCKRHGQSEANLMRSGLAWTMLRPPFFMQNLLGLAGMIKSGTIYQPAGGGKAGWIDVRDIAAVAASALTEDGHAGQTYEITGPELVAFSDIAAVFSNALGRTINYVEVPPAAAKQSMMQAGMPDWMADGVNALFADLRAGRFNRLTDTVRSVGHKQPVTLETFVNEHLSDFR